MTPASLTVYFLTFYVFITMYLQNICVYYMFCRENVSKYITDQQKYVKTCFSFLQCKQHFFKAEK